MKEVSAALVRAQKAFGPALKTHTNPAFKSKYADLSACVEAVIDALNANGIALVQRNHPSEGGICIETLFVHESGESLSSGMLHVPASKQDPQGYGSALTYARRYSLMAACGIAPEDDDGNAASKGNRGVAAPVSGPISATRLAYEALNLDWQAWIDAWAVDVQNIFDQSGPAAAQQLIEDAAEKEHLQNEHRVALYHKLPSNVRTGLDRITKSQPVKKVA